MTYYAALTAQSLSVIIAMIPHIKDTFQQLLPARQQILLSDFDRLLKDCKDHRSELFQKLVSIMQERLEGHIQKLHVRFP